MTKATLKKWQRDALEVMHTLKHESDEKSIQLKAYAKRIVVLTDMLIPLKED